MVGAIAIAAMLAVLLVAVVDLGVLRVIGEPKGPGHLGSMRFRDPSALGSVGPDQASRAGAGTFRFAPQDTGDD
jgi:hypothetical protein